MINMCKISKTTVLRVNKKMIERKNESRANNFSMNGDIQVSVFANGKIYSQIVTGEQIRTAFALAMNK